MARKGSYLAAVTGSVIFATAGAALASPPLPHKAKAYDNGDFLKHSLGVVLVINATNPKVIQAGQAAFGSQFADSELAIQCPRAKRNPGFHMTPLTLVGFPRTTLTLSHGSYGFSRKLTVGRQSVGGSSAKPFKLHVTITGTVVSPTSITGTATASGGPCTTRHPLKYTAKLDGRASVGPGQ